MIINNDFILEEAEFVALLGMGIENLRKTLQSHMIILSCKVIIRDLFYRTISNYRYCDIIIGILGNFSDFN